MEPEPASARALWALALLLAVISAAAGGCKGKRAGSRENRGEGAEKAATRSTPPRDGSVAGAAAAMAEVIVLTGVQVAIVDPPGPSEITPVELYPRQLGRQVGRQLGESGLFADRHELVPDGHRPRPAELEVTMRYYVIDSDRDRTDPAGQTGRAPTQQSMQPSMQRAVIALESALVWQDGSERPAPWSNLIVERPVSRHELSNIAGILATLAEHSMREMGEGLIARERVRVGGVEAVRQGLASGDSDTRLWSLELCAARRSVELFDEVARVLSSTDSSERDRAIAALVAMGDPRAVDLLARRAPFDDLDLLPAVIDGIITLGGDDAVEYLEFVASGHPEDDIRQRARQGLSRLKRPASR